MNVNDPYYGGFHKEDRGAHTQSSRPPFQGKHWQFVLKSTTNQRSLNCNKTSVSKQSVKTAVNYNMETGWSTMTPFINCLEPGLKCFEIQEVFPVTESTDLLRGSWRCGGRTRGGLWSHTGPVCRQEALECCSWWSHVSEAEAQHTHNTQMPHNAFATMWLKCKKKADKKKNKTMPVWGFKTNKMP